MLSSDATRFDVIPDQSAVAPGSTATGKLYPTSGNWASGTVTLTRATGATISVTLPSSGSAAVAYRFTAGRAGGELLTATNDAKLRNPPTVSVAVFASSSGSFSVLTFGTFPGSYRAQRTFQQCVWSGTAAAFTGVGGVTLSNGWGRVRIPFASNASAVFARLTDADSSGATAEGGGTVITTIAQVFGVVTAGTTVPLLLPASDYCVYLDLATDAAFTNPVRVPFPFFVRDVALVVTRSLENMLFGSFAAGIPGTTNWSSYQKVTGLGSQNPGNNGYEVAAVNSWLRVDGKQTYGNNGMAFGGVGAQELGRLFATRKGTGLSILGLTPAGGDMDQFWAEDGTPCNSARALLDAVEGEARYVIFQSSGWSSLYAPESAREYQKVFQAIPARLMTLYPTIAVVSGESASGQFGPDGSRATGYTRQNMLIRAVEQVDPCVVASDAASDWNAFYGNSGHASWESAIRYARARARSLLLAEGSHAGGFGRNYADRYTRFAATGTMAVGSGVIRIPFTLAPGATALIAKQWKNGITSAAAWSYSTPTAANLAKLVAVYRGANKQFIDHGPSGHPEQTTDPVVQVAGAIVDNAAGTLNIAVSSIVTGPLTVQIMADFGRSTGFSLRYDDSFCVGLFDNRDLGDGCGYGPHIRAQLDIAVI